MAHNKKINLKKARNEQKIGIFCKDYPSSGDEVRFDKLLLEMARKRPEADQTSDEDASAC